VVAGTPYYVLMEGSHRIGPMVIPLQSGVECSPIYGFSDKEPFDKFCEKSELALKPYPLVKLYLREQTSVVSDVLRLVVIDAVGPREPYLQAATMEAVLDAQEKRTPEVAVAYRFVFDQHIGAYRVEETSV
jgi:hypothetical protein